MPNFIVFLLRIENIYLLSAKKRKTKKFRIPAPFSLLFNNMLESAVHPEVARSKRSAQWPAFAFILAGRERARSRKQQTFSGRPFLGPAHHG